ncbi:hypothetical protein MKW94_016953 [Papaver nudicaule]|uniref:Uncharacterized protein n=1 Tax=Papaver nudicaule TaxID=74823 RepID=A0AA41S7N5_PAPNU|nr:hypothetical protein [Papaver nudicaule]
MLPPEFIEEIKGSGLLEKSLSSGVPVICWPFIGDQLTNCRYSCHHWGVGMEIDSNVKRDEVGVGMEIDSNVKRDEVEKVVRELIEGGKGKNIKKRAMEWKKKAEGVISPGGSSYVNLEKIVTEILASKIIDQ